MKLSSNKILGTDVLTSSIIASLPILTSSLLESSSNEGTKCFSIQTSNILIRSLSQESLESGYGSSELGIEGSIFKKTEEGRRKKIKKRNREKEKICR